MSMPKKKGLGRGLTALFGDQKVEVKKKEKTSHNRLRESISDLSPNKYQPRVHFDEEKLVELANSIRKNGIIQPIAVREDTVDPGRFEIVAGERRWLAAQKAGLHEVPIVILDLDDNEALEVAIVENIQRDDLNAIEEAKGYERLSEEYKEGSSSKQEELPKNQSKYFTFSKNKKRTKDNDISTEASTESFQTIDVFIDDTSRTFQSPTVSQSKVTKRKK